MNIKNLLKNFVGKIKLLAFNISSIYDKIFPYSVTQIVDKSKRK